MFFEWLHQQLYGISIIDIVFRILFEVCCIAVIVCVIYIIIQLVKSHNEKVYAEERAKRAAFRNHQS